MSNKQKKPILSMIIALFVLLFGIATLVEGGGNIFRYSTSEMVEKQIVPFILIFNFISAFVYFIVFWGIFKDKEWTKIFSMFLVISIAIAYIFFGFHVYQGGTYLQRTAYAMPIRLIFWIFITVWIWRKK